MGHLNMICVGKIDDLESKKVKRIGNGLERNESF